MTFTMIQPALKILNLWPSVRAGTLSGECEIDFLHLHENTCRNKKLSHIQKCQEMYIFYFAASMLTEQAITDFLSFLSPHLSRSLIPSSILLWICSLCLGPQETVTFNGCPLPRLLEFPQLQINCQRKSSHHGNQLPARRAP